MPVKTVCPSCHIALSVKDELLGKNVRCKECGNPFTVREAGAGAGGSDEPKMRNPARPPSRSGEAVTTRPRPLREDEDDEPRRRDDDEDDDRPRKRRKKSGNDLGKILLIVGGVGLLFLVLLGTAVAVMMKKMHGNIAPPPVAVGPNAPVNPGLFNPPNPPPVAPVNPPPVNPPPAPVNPMPAPANPPPAANPPQVVETVRLPNPRWGSGFGFGKKMEKGFGGDFQVDYEFLSGRRPVGKSYTLMWRYPDGTLGSAALRVVFDARGTLQVHIIGPAGSRKTGAMEMWLEDGRQIGHIRTGSGARVSNIVNLN